MTGRPIPVPDDDTKDFWDAARRHELVIQRCTHCGHFAHPPVEFCPACHRLDAPAFAFEPVSGRGRIVSWTVVHDAMVSGFEGQPPWANVVARLDDQDDLYLMATLEAPADGEVLTLGAPVEVTFSDVTPEISLPTFRLVEEDR